MRQMAATLMTADLPVLLRRFAGPRYSSYGNSHLSSTCLNATVPIITSVRAQGSFGRGSGRGGGNFSRGGSVGRGGRGFGAGGKAPAEGPQRRALINQTHDGELSEGTRVVMRDDTKVLMNVIKHIPQNGAITIKSLNAQLSPDVQEAVSEKHNGLKNFLEQRKQLFIVKANPSDGVLYAAATPLAYQKLMARERQRETMKEMLGITRRDSGRRGGGPGRGRGRGGGRFMAGGGGFRGRDGGGREGDRGRFSGGGRENEGRMGRGDGGGGGFGARSRR